MHFLKQQQQQQQQQQQKTHEEYLFLIRTLASVTHAFMTQIA